MRADRGKKNILFKFDSIARLIFITILILKEMNTVVSKKYKSRQKIASRTKKYKSGQKLKSKLKWIKYGYYLFQIVIFLNSIYIYFQFDDLQLLFVSF